MSAGGVTSEDVRRYCANHHVYCILLQLTGAEHTTRIWIDPKLGRITGVADHVLDGHDRIYFHCL